MSNYTYELWLAVVIVACWVAAILFIRHGKAKSLRPVLARQAEINARPLDAVQKEVEQLLISDANWTHELSQGAFVRLDQVTNAFFSKYKTVAAYGMEGACIQ